VTTFQHLFTHIKQYGGKHRLLYVVSLMVFFWTIFDGIISYFTPIVITDAGISETLMGVIIGSSSIAGMFFDFLLCRILKNTHYRRLYLGVFAISLVYPLILWQSKSIILYFIAMALWGLYYDLFNIGGFDFVGRNTKKSEHTSSCGVMSVFRSLGYLIAPLIAAFLAGKFMIVQPYIAAWVFLGISLMFFIILMLVSHEKKAAKNKEAKATCEKPSNLFRELHLWKKIGVVILPVLVLTFILNIIDSFFWTIGPLISESLPGMGQFGGLFIVAYQLPPLLVGWFVGNFTAKVGKKKTAFISLLLGSLVFCSFAFIHSPFVLIAVTFLAAFFIGLAWPSLNGAYADYISEAPKVEKEIETIEDTFTNLGYFIGPILAGFAGEHLGHMRTFSLMGIVGVILALILLKVTPKSIKVENKAD